MTTDPTEFSSTQETLQAIKRILPRFDNALALGRSPFANWRIVRQQASQYSNQYTEEELGRAVQAVIRQAIGELKAVPVQNPEKQKRDHQILTGLFCEALPAEKIYTEILHISRAQYYRERKRALLSLADFLHQWETSAASVQDGLHTLPPTTYTRLFGVDDLISEVLNVLTNTASASLISLDGLGGIGKTAAGRETASRAMQEQQFETLIWITAQRTVLTWDGIIPLDCPALTADTMMNAIAEGLGLRNFKSLPSVQKRDRLSQYLAKCAALIVVDNLETAADWDAILDTLGLLTRSSHTKVLLTSRHRFSGLVPIRAFHLQPLSRSETLAFIRYLAMEKGERGWKNAEDDQLAPIWETTGGNPLAIKLVVGQASSLPLAQVIQDLQGIGGVSDHLYSFIYRYSWDLLSSPSQEVLLSLPHLSPAGAAWEELQAVSELKSDVLNTALVELVRFSLINVSGGIDRIYSLHPLTRQFILTDLIRYCASEK